MIKETLVILSEDKPAFEAACEKASVTTTPIKYKDSKFAQYEVQAVCVYQIFLAGKYFGIQSVFDIQNKLTK